MPSSHFRNRALRAAALCSLVASNAWALELQLPLDPADAGFSFLGVAGFGYHVAEHRLDGHPGLDFELRLGGKVRAAHAGRLSHFTDSYDPSKTTFKSTSPLTGRTGAMCTPTLAVLNPE